MWRELAGSHIFITGGTGFFGIWLLESIAAANDTLGVGVGATVLSRDPGPFLARMPHLASRNEFAWLCGHPANFSYPDTTHDYIVHLATATSAHLGQTNPIEMLHTKLASIRHVLGYAHRAGVRRMLVTSSGAVYGPQPPELSHIPETYTGAPAPLNPASAYGTGKRLVEQICALTPEVDTVIARCFSFIGPHLPLDARFAAGNFLRDALAGGPIVVRGDGSAVRSYLHAADLTIWLLTMLVRGKARRAYNLGGDSPVTIGELARLAADCGGKQATVTLTESRTAAPISIYVPDVARAAAEFGLSPTIDLKEAISRTMGWLQKLHKP